MTDFGKLLAPYVRQLGNLFGRGEVTGVNGGTKMRTLQISLLAGEPKDDVEHFEPYGFTSEVKVGSEPLALFFDGDRSHGVVVVVADRRYRLTGLQSGEVAIYDDLGQKVHLTRDGIVIDGAGLPMIFTNTPTVRMETDRLECTGEIVDRCDSDGRSMEEMRTVHNGHTHHENDANGETDNPTQQM